MFKKLLLISHGFTTISYFLPYHTVSLNTCIAGTHKYTAACEVVCICAWVWAWGFSSFSICSYYYSLKSNTK